MITVQLRSRCDRTRFEKRARNSVTRPCGACTATALQRRPVASTEVPPEIIEVQLTLDDLLGHNSHTCIRTREEHGTIHTCAVSVQYSTSDALLGQLQRGKGLRAGLRGDFL